MVKIYIIVQYAESLRCFTLTDDERFLSRFGVFLQRLYICVMQLCMQVSMPPMDPYDVLPHNIVRIWRKDLYGIDSEMIGLTAFQMYVLHFRHFFENWKNSRLTPGQNDDRVTRT